MGRTLLLVLFVLLPISAEESTPSAGEGSWRYSLGMRAQGYYDFEPGNDYFPGLQAGISPGGWFRHRAQFRIAYLTNRLEEASGRFIIIEDYYLLSGAWHFRPFRKIDPYVKLDWGLNHFDSDGLDIPGNPTWIRAISVGTALSPLPNRFAFYYDFGYSLNTSSTVFPGVFSAGFLFHFPHRAGSHGD